MSMYFINILYKTNFTRKKVSCPVIFLYIPENDPEKLCLKMETNVQDESRRDAGKKNTEIRDAVKPRSNYKKNSPVRARGAESPAGT